MSGAGVIAVTVRDYRPRRRPYRIDEEIARNAAQPGGRRAKQVVRSGHGSINDGDHFSSAV
jgi:hypothetical protein